MLRNLTVLSSRQRVSDSVGGTGYMLPLDGVSLEQTEVQVLETPKHAIYWSGFLYRPAAARIPTSEGRMSLSSEPGAVAVDLGKYDQPGEPTRQEVRSTDL